MTSLIAALLTLHRDAYADTPDAGSSCTAGCGAWPCNTVRVIRDTETPTPDFTSPIAGRIEVRQPCPWCGDQQMIPRSQFDEHVMRLHPDVRTAEYRAAAEAHNARLAFRGTQHTTETGETAPAVLAVASNPLVQGRCPACGWATLFLADGGYLTCSRLECPRPDAASTLLEHDPRTPAAPGLRDRIAQALADYDLPYFSRQRRGEVADAVLAVLPTPADRAAEADTIGLCGYCGVPRESHHHGYVSTAAANAAAPHRINCDHEQQPAPAPADRAAVLREAADRINALPQDHECDPGRGDAAEELRRMADEAQQNGAPS